MIYDILIDLIRKHWLKYLSYTTIAIIVLLSLVFFINNAVVFVEVDDEKNNQSSFYSVLANTKTERINVGNAGMVFVPRTTQSLTVSSGEYKKTRTPLSIPFYGFVSVKVKINSDVNAIKVPFRSTLTYTCPAFEPSDQELLFFECNNPKGLLSFSYNQESDGVVKRIASLDYSSTPIRPFLGGVIGISLFPNSDYVTRGDITHVDGQGKAYAIPGPTGLDKNEIRKSTIYSNTKSSSDNTFAIVDRQGTIFIGKFFSNRSTEYTKIAAPDDYTVNYNHTRCSFTNEKLYCYRGPIAYGEYPDAFDFSKVTQSEIFEYDLKKNTQKTYRISMNFYGVEEFAVTESKKIYITIGKNLNFLEFTDNKSYRPIEVSQNVDDIFGGENLIYIQEKGVFVVDDKDNKTSYQLFYSPNINPITLYAPEGKIFLLAQSGDNKKLTYAYEILKEKNINGGSRLIDLIPIKTEGIRDLYSSDLVNNTVIITLPQFEDDLSQSKRSERISLKKEEIINYLNDKGYEINSGKLVVK